MNSSQSPSDAVGPLIRFAQWCAALCLLVAPFRASAGLRAGLLVVAGGLLVVDFARRGALKSLLPARSIATDGILFWALVCFAWCVYSANPALSFGAFKGDLLTPLLAGAVFFALTRNERDMARWSRMLVIGLIGLALVIVIEPFKQGGMVPRPWYSGVGSVSTWIVTVAALLPVMWALHGPERSLRWWAIGAAIAMLAIAFLSGNRTVWICFAMMLIAFAMLAWTQGKPRQTRTFIALVLGISLLAALFVLSRQLRFEGAVDESALAALEMHDNRLTLWQKAFDLAMERPFAGRGFGREVVQPDLIARFADPYYRGLFLQGHNLILNYALQMGVAGVAGILLLFTTLAMYFLRACAGLAQRQSAMQMCPIAGCLLVVGVFAKNMTDDFFIRQNALLFFAMVGMLAGWAQHGSGSDNSE